jgi:capsid protein
MQLIDPDRLSNPYGDAESPTLRQGVQLGAAARRADRLLVPRRPSVRLAERAASATWSYMPREKAWGRPMVLHGFEVERDGQVRGRPPLASIVEALFLKDIYERGEANVTILNALYAATLETEFGTDPELAKEIFGADPATQKPARRRHDAPRRPGAGAAARREAEVQRAGASGRGAVHAVRGPCCAASRPASACPTSR